ncbi:MAG: hypothetical protein WC677_02650 [Clostridia bacterium]|jgi:hypothetical protein
MLVNSINITSYNATLMKKDIQTATVTIFDDWLRNAVNPLYLGKQEMYKRLKLRLLIKNSTDELCIINISNFIKQLEVCTIKFDGLSFYYDCTLVSQNHTRFKKGWYALDVELKAPCAYIPKMYGSQGGYDTHAITVGGNQPTSCVISLTSVNASTLTVNVAGQIYVISNITGLPNITIDGELCKVLSGTANKFGDTVMAQFPILNLGSNLITISTSAFNYFSCTYKERYI